MQGVGVVAFCGFDIIRAADVLELVVVPNHIIVQTFPIVVDFHADGRVGGNPRNLHSMADDRFIVHL